MPHRRKIILTALMTIVLCVACDRLTKTAAELYLPKGKELSMAGGTVEFFYYENKGGIFSIEEPLPEGLRGPVFTAAVAAFLSAILLYLLFAPHPGMLSAVALSLVFGGALGNLLDRIGPHNRVIDFVSLCGGGYCTNIFNMADVAIVCGLALLTARAVFGLLRTGRRAAH